MELNEMRELALEALGARLERIKAQIEGLRNELAGRSSGSLTKKKHRISAEGRARIAAAQKRRWAAVRKAS